MPNDSPDIGDLDPFGTRDIDRVQADLDSLTVPQVTEPDAENQHEESNQANSEASHEKEQDESPPPTNPSGSPSNDDSQPPSQQGADDVKTESKPAPTKSRSISTVVGTPGGRGRGGKGKRLRDIADDLGASSRIEKSGDDASRKRPADEMSGADGNAAKVSKSDSGLASEANGEGKNGNSSLASSMPKGDVEQHLLFLHKGLHLTSRTITHKCLPIVQELIDDPFGWVFRDAVDPVVFGLPDYFEVVKNPMHLLLVKKKLENAVYTDMASFERDVKLVFENAILYNGEESEVGQLAKSMMGVFEREYKKVCEGM